MAANTSFLGVGWRFPPAFDVRTKQAVMVAAEEDVRESILILLSTEPGERVMQPSYGCGLRHLVFEHIDDSRITELKDIVAKAVLFFEPRVTLESVSVDDSDLFEGLLRIHLEYTIRTTNNRYNLVYPFYLLEASGEGYQS